MKQRKKNLNIDTEVYQSLRPGTTPVPDRRSFKCISYAAYECRFCLLIFVPENKAYKRNHFPFLLNSICLQLVVSLSSFLASFLTEVQMIKYLCKDSDCTFLFDIDLPRTLRWDTVRVSCASQYGTISGSKDNSLKVLWHVNFISFLKYWN